MTILLLDADAIPETSHHQVILASRVDLNLIQPPIRFFRHGWQSWTLTSWLDPSDPPLPIRAPEFRAKDEDPKYAFHKNHVSAWVGAVEIGDDDILLVGALDLGGRIELSDYTLKCFYENEHEGKWLIARGKEDEVFMKYVDLLESTFGKTRYKAPPRVWCSWYSLYKWINESILTKALHGIGDLPFDVFQIDDGWQIAHGDWQPNGKFPNGMEPFVEKIKATGRTPGIWLAPFMVSSDSRLAKDHPDWLLRDENDQPVPGGISWGGKTWVLDSGHPEVLEWMDALIRKVTGWGYGYLKLDFLYQGALVGKRYTDVPREEAYRRALQVIRDAAGEAYILACGAPIVPSLGLCDGIRIGPDVTNFWVNTALTTWLNNPNETSTVNALRTSVHRLWLKPLVNIDPDVLYFRSRFNALKPDEIQLLRDLAMITGFKATSDLPWWLNLTEFKTLEDFLGSTSKIERVGRYQYQVDRRKVDFSLAIPIPKSNLDLPVWLARIIGFARIGWYQILPALWEFYKS